MLTLTADELKAKMDADETFMLVDIRNAEHYEHNHIASAVNLPYDTNFVETAAKVLLDKEVPVIVYADFHGKQECFDAIKKLQELGYQQVDLFDSGLHGWMEAGHQLQFGEEC